MLLRTLQRGELTGGKGWPRSCLDLPAAFLERLDAPERVIHGEKPREAMPALLRQLEQHILRHGDPKGARFRELVLTLGKRVCESSQQRRVFVECCGDVLLVRLLLQLVPTSPSPNPNPTPTPSPNPDPDPNPNPDPKPKPNPNPNPNNKFFFGISE
jgi:hypothetical protein